MRSRFIKLVRSSVVRWVARSLPGHIILFGLVWPGVANLLMMALSYSEGDLTVSGALHGFIVFILGGVILGLIVWFTVTRPLIRWKKQVASQKARKPRESEDKQ